MSFENCFLIYSMRYAASHSCLHTPTRSLWSRVSAHRCHVLKLVLVSRVSAVTGKRDCDPWASGQGLATSTHDPQKTSNVLKTVALSDLEHTHTLAHTRTQAHTHTRTYAHRERERMRETCTQYIKTCTRVHIYSFFLCSLTAQSSGRRDDLQREWCMRSIVIIVHCPLFCTPYLQVSQLSAYQLLVHNHSHPHKHTGKQVARPTRPLCTFCFPVTFSCKVHRVFDLLSHEMRYINPLYSITSIKLW